MNTQNNSITPCIWLDNEAEEAAEFYSSLFENSKVDRIIRYGKEGFEYHHKPEGSVMTVEFELNGQNFLALNGGPDFKLNESASLFVYCETEERINFLYDKLSEGGSINMPLDKYDWSPKYAWVKDKFGLSWQLDIEAINSPQKIVPTLLFVNDKYSLVKEAITYYTSIFPDSKILMEYPEKDYLLFGQVKLNGYLLNLLSGGKMTHNFDFNDALSLIIYCDTQDEINYYWNKLTDGGKEVQCGWLKDKFGVSWQVVPKILNELISNPKKSSKTMNAIFGMVKFDIKKLIEAGNE
ncbi:VOC family protein [Melioribacteraceae bacterium 4301-Me]|uniref:VOC family protein n=1 Tax=Pyranulibacter aquaticus TaxID=3163344 RepID=UPI0035959E4F